MIFAWDEKKPKPKYTKETNVRREKSIKYNQAEWNSTTKIEIIAIIAQEIGKHIQIGANRMPLMFIHMRDSNFELYLKCFVLLFAILISISSTT